MKPSDQISSVARLNKQQEKGLKKLNLNTVEDLLYHFPTRYEEKKETKYIRDLKKGDDVDIFGIIKNLKTKKAYRKKIPMAEGILEDDTGKIKIIWFSQAFIAKTFSNNQYVKISGKIVFGKQGKYVANPLIEKVDSNIQHAGPLFSNGVESGTLIPTYKESRGITSLWFYHTIKKILNSGIIRGIEDPLSEEILRKYNLPKLSSAIVWVHIPRNHSDMITARKRLSFQEVFFIQLERLIARESFRKSKGYTVKSKKEELNEFIKRFPYKLTSAQERAIEEIRKDISEKIPMARLLEGDVGSGKTAVSASISYVVTMARIKDNSAGNLQTAYMVPTEILAKQHFESFISYFSHLNINIGLITSSECRKFPSKVDPNGHTHISRTQLLKWVKNGEVPILIGTHSLIQDKVNFKDLALVIIDEQHRFGVMQRAKLAKKGNGRVPHLLSMTATPIPRTLALTIYGDLDLTLLDEMPKGRKQIITKIIEKNKRKEIYEEIRKEIKKGRQVYVICPRIDEPDPKKALSLRVKSAKEESKRLKEEIFPEFQIGLVHSKLKPKEKADVMESFVKGNIDILTSTSVIEVGVNVPNATIIVIEGAERFGLAQLHQLRGRVLRSSHQSYCYIFSDSNTKKVMERLKAIVTAKNGFDLAEKDLLLRGEGMLSGEKQWGISDIAMDAIKNIEMVEAGRNEARKIIEKDNTLSSYPKLKERVEKSKELHLE